MEGLHSVLSLLRWQLCWRGWSAIEFGYGYLGITLQIRHVIVGAVVVSCRCPAKLCTSRVNNLAKDRDLKLAGAQPVSKSPPPKS
jgi:hypothetical protein